MVLLINRLTGTDMWVDESRLSDYLAAGHRRPVATPADGKEPEQKPPKKSTAKRRKKDG